MNTQAPKRELAAVDIFKFFCALLVIAIHTKPFINHFWLDAGIGVVTRFAVPYFFLSSAYFLFTRMEGKDFSACKDIYLQYFVRLLRFYAIWFILFRFYDGFFNQSCHGTLWYLKQFVFPTDGSPLWFVAALVWGTFLVFVLNSVLRNKTVVFVISIIFLLIGYSLSTMLNETGSSVPVVWLNQTIIPAIGTQNGFFFAFPYVAMGALMAGRVFEKKYLRDLCGTAFFLGLLGVEAVAAVKVFHAPLTFLWLSAVPMTFFVMRFTLTIDLKSRPIFYYIRKMSTLIYVVHVLVFKTFQHLFAATGFDRIDSENLCLFFAVVMVSSALAYVLVEFSRRRGLGFLKYIM